MSDENQHDYFAHNLMRQSDVIAKKGYSNCKLSYKNNMKWEQLVGKAKIIYDYFFYHNVI
jgi:hypothetical protein